jgi:hypothetical protein
MKIYRNFNKTFFRYVLTNLTLLTLCSCNNPSEKILGDWTTSSNCTSKKGVTVNYVGFQKFSKDEIVKDKGTMTIQSTDPQGRVVGTEVDVFAESYWSIDNKKIHQKNISTSYNVRSIKINSSPVYTQEAMIINSNGNIPTSQNSPQAVSLAASIVDEMNKTSKEYNDSDFELVQIDDEKLIVKNKSIEHLNNFDPGVCETQTYTRSVTSAFNLDFR